jgi:hypothetical protein
MDPRALQRQMLLRLMMGQAQQGPTPMPGQGTQPQAPLMVPTPPAPGFAPQPFNPPAANTGRRRG